MPNTRTSSTGAVIAVAISAILLGSNHAAKAADRAALLQEFPPEVRPLITPSASDALVAALLEVRKSGPKTLVFNNSGGERADGQRSAFVSDWEKITGWRVKDSGPAVDPARLKVLVGSGHPDIDLVELGSLGDGISNEKSNFYALLDRALFDPVFASFPKEGGYQHSDYWVQNGWYSITLLWDTRKWPESGPHPTTPNDLFDTARFPGKRCLFKYPEYAGTLEYPLLADGVSPDKLYPLDVERALKKLDTIRDDIVWFSTGAESVQNIVNGNCALGVTWHGRAAARLKEDPSLPLGVSWEKTLLIDDGWAIPKGAPNAEAANTLLAFAFTPENEGKLLNLLGYGIPIDPAFINADGRKWGVTLENLKLSAAKQDPAYYADNASKIVTRFNEWLAE